MEDRSSRLGDHGRYQSLVESLVRFACVLLLFAIACLLSGIYGAIHNQISYSVSPEYFTKFKFEQFELAPTLWNRQGASIVGWRASWWMGLVIGAFLIPFGLLIRQTSTYFLFMLRAFVIVLVTSTCFAIVALVVSKLMAGHAEMGELNFRGNQILNPVAFLVAGTMHTASYLGGLVGMLIGMASILRSFLLAETGSAKIFGRTRSID